MTEDERVKELEKIICDGVLKDHNGCQIYHDEEYTKLESKFYEAEERIKELEEGIEKHRNGNPFMKQRFASDYFIKRDEELYKLVLKI